MVRFAFATVILVHGFIHFMLISERIGPSDFNGIRWIHVLWFGVFAVFLLAVVSYLEKSKNWWMFCLAGVVLSQSLILADWQRAKTGTAANLLLLTASVVGFARQRFDKKTASAVSAMFQDAMVPDGFITRDKIRHLPAPVQSWLLRSGIVGRQAISVVRLKQKGQIRLKAGYKNWIKVTAVQYVTVNKPAFIWSAGIRLLPFLPLTGCDSFVSGKGSMNVKILSLIPAVNQSDEKIDQGALQRWLAEICWYPSAALSRYIRWEGIDGSTAKATIKYAGIQADMNFHFHANGDLAGCYADRFMGGGRNAKRLPWHVTFLSSSSFGGIRVPNRVEATWKLKSGDFTWYKMAIDEIEYNKPWTYEGKGLSLL